MEVTLSRHFEEHILPEMNKTLPEHYKRVQDNLRGFQYSTSGHFHGCYDNLCFSTCTTVVGTWKPFGMLAWCYQEPGTYWSLSTKAATCTHHWDCKEEWYCAGDCDTGPGWPWYKKTCDFDFNNCHTTSIDDQP
jgi:hypothetical protein